MPYLRVLVAEKERWQQRKIMESSTYGTTLGTRGNLDTSFWSSSSGQTESFDTPTTPTTRTTR